MPLLSLALACLPQAQEPVTPLPDPGDFVLELLREATPSAEAIWQRYAALTRGRRDSGPGFQFDWSDAKMAAAWSEIADSFRPHFGADRFALTFDRPGSQERANWLMKIPARMGEGMELQSGAKTLLLDLQSQPAGAAVRIGTSVPAAGLGEDEVLFLYAESGAWRIQGLGFPRREEDPAPPRCASAQPAIRDGRLNAQLTFLLAPPLTAGGPARTIPTFDVRPRPEPADAAADRFGAARLSAELETNVPKFEQNNLRAGRPVRFVVDAPAAVPLRDLLPLAWLSDPAQPLHPILDFRVELDGAQRPGWLRFDPSALTTAASVNFVEVGTPPSAWPEALRTGAPPAAVGIALRKDATVQDLATTADALLARGVILLFLAPPFWDPSRDDDPDARARDERYWRLFEAMRGGEQKPDDDR